MRHHTKDKGDIGVTQVIAHLTKNNWQVCLPLSEHLPFDLIAVDSAMKLYRVQVKYRAVYNDKIDIQLFGSASNSRGVYRKPYILSEFDIIAVYNPDSDKCFYIKVSTIPVGSLLLRFRLKKATGNNGSTVIPLIDDYMDLEKLKD